MQSRMTCQMPSSSMEPTIKKGAWIVADTRYYNSCSVGRFDVAVFWNPDVERELLDISRARVAEGEGINELLSTAGDIWKKNGPILRPHLLFVKRIVGLPKETIRLTQEGIEIDEKRVNPPRDLRKLYSSITGKFKYGAECMAVPDDSIFVLSDNVNDGKDSRHIGTVPVGHLVGRICM